ncbi:MAG: hypothetical protein ACI38Q_04020 [Candidatus Bruticola sp.]
MMITDSLLYTALTCIFLLVWLSLLIGLRYILDKHKTAESNNHDHGSGSTHRNLSLDSLRNKSMPILWQTSSVLIVLPFLTFILSALRPAFKLGYIVDFFSLFTVTAICAAAVVSTANSDIIFNVITHNVKDNNREQNKKVQQSSDPNSQ